MKHFLAILLIAFAVTFAASANADSLRDPTQPPMAAKEKESVATVAPLRVAAIFRSGETHSALVDGKLVRPGDRIGAALIEEITHDSVRYSRGGRSEIARLKTSKLQVRRAATVEEDT